MIQTETAMHENIYKILDRVAETGVPAEINRGGQKLRIVSVPGKRTLGKAKKRSLIIGDSEDLVHIDWSHLWRP
jgi:hypothetical protein